MNLQEQLAAIVGKEQLLVNEPMKRHTTLQIGGPADYFVTVCSEKQLQKLLMVCRESKEPYFLLGNGSNLLVADAGYRGIVIRLAHQGNAATVLNEQIIKTAEGTNQQKSVTVRLESGAMLNRAAMTIADLGLAGFEFAAGIPGTLGGAVIMNAGAYDGEIKDFIQSARIMDSDGNISTYSAEELKLGYRSSALQETNKIVLSADFVFSKGERTAILVKIEDLNTRRRNRQPLEYKSAGSTFKRPEGYFAGKLIMEAGLAGFRIGDAQVSEKHCGFLINRGTATAKEFLQLVNEVTERVEENSGVRLEPEIRFLGSD